MIGPLVVRARLVWLEVPLMILASVLVFVFGLKGRIGRVDGLILFGGLICYMTWTVFAARREAKQVQEELATRAGAPVRTSFERLIWYLGWLVAGLVVLIYAAALLVKGAVAIAENLGVSKLMIGLTIVAIGTSLPEVATCVVASYRGQRDIAVGNVVGSNILNILAVLGLGAIVVPRGIAVTDVALWFDIPVMIAVSFACLPIIISGHRINRWEGVLFFVYYIIYMTYLVLAEIQSDFRQTYEKIVLFLFVPLTVVVLFASFVYRPRNRNT